MYTSSQLEDAVHTYEQIRVQMSQSELGWQELAC